MIYEEEKGISIICNNAYLFTGDEHCSTGSSTGNYTG